MSGGRKIHVLLTQVQVDALMQLGEALDALDPRPRKSSGHGLIVAALTEIDEQQAAQTAIWEVCSTCKGSGWVEAGT